MFNELVILQDLVIILGFGYLAGLAVEQLKLPRLLGMLLAGIVAGPYALNLLSAEILSAGEQIRTLALIVILLKAGLGMDRQLLQRYGSVVLRLGFLPCLLEALAVALIVQLLLGWDFIYCLLLGWIVCAESPAVIVPVMQKLKSRGWGVRHGIPDLILAGGVISDVVAITVFGVIISMVAVPAVETAFMLPGMWNLPLQVGGGLIAGYLAGSFIYYSTKKTQLGFSSMQGFVVALLMGTLMVLGGNVLNFSGYLAVMVMGIVLLELSPVVSRRIRIEVDRAWFIAQIFLFVLIGAVVNVNVLFAAGLTGIGIIAFGFCFGRIPGVLLSAVGSPFSLHEKLFMGLAYIPKATVQAALGSLPLSLGLPHGEYILAVAVLSIIVTAPSGAAVIKFAAPRLLKKGKVDPTKINVEKKYRFLVALNNTEPALRAFAEAAELARQVDASVYLVHIQHDGPLNRRLENMEQILSECCDLDADVTVEDGDPAAQIVSEALRVNADYIFMGKINYTGSEPGLLGNIAEEVVRQSPVPVILVR